MKMIEKVARALWFCETKYEPTEDQLKTSIFGLECLNKAKTAIEAMKEPDKAMLAVKTSSIDYSSDEIWKMFIEAALKE